MTKLEREKLFDACRRFEIRYQGTKANRDTAADRALYLLYKNYKNEVAWRWVVPLERAPEFTSTPHHPNAQWIMRVFDLDKGEERSYAMADILRVVKDEGQGRPAGTGGNTFDVTILLKTRVHEPEDGNTPEATVQQAWWDLAEYRSDLPDGTVTHVQYVEDEEEE